MSVPVEARSLSDLTTLFANPPQYPRNPTHQALSRLTLYIVRVPGSRDVFLSPVRPPHKASVSLDAIQSALYYVHVNDEQDEGLRANFEEQRQDQERERAASAHEIHRKPLPVAPYSNYPPSERPVVPPKSYPHYQPPPPHDVPDTQLARQVARAQHVRLQTDIPTANGSVRRRPLGPRPFHSRHSSSDSNTIERKPVGEGDLDFERSVNRMAATPVPPEFSPVIESKSALASALQGDNTELWEKQESSSMMRLFFSLTVIRRDTASGAQWNVGTVENFTRHANGLETMRVEITTPGYQKFARQGDVLTSQQMPSSAGDAEAIKKFIAGTNDSPSAPTSSSPSSAYFSRDLRPVRAIPSDRNRFRSNSENLSFPKMGAGRDSTIPARNFHYSFTSPWQGECTFSTGMNGRSFRCRHTILSNASENERQTMNIADLRFNLPWAVFPGKDLNGGPGHKTTGSLANAFTPPSKEALRRSVQKFRNGLSRDRDNLGYEESHSINTLSFKGPTDLESDSDSDSSGRMDLRLGRERAGGGWQGKSAKLGKLVIEDEGLKMCDLVVSSCMAVFWKYFEARS